MGFATGLGAAAIPAAAGGWVVPSGSSGLPASFGGDSVLTALTPGQTVLPLDERPSAIADRLASKIDGMQAGGDTHIHNNTFNITSFSPKDTVDPVNKALRLGGGRLRTS